ncbi:pantoate-beta-alanine ligase [Besnoitia besnoiti]|uniref:Pantoate--beta-alanine ligase n=1 Tax=Besnoitia besnoiti TaxID=94643 RepID=A0A2A9MMB9_BESBE|nr:pantoate-beta-alanine ligase [Besnoitia besnoiti]PFH36700.1 pantoate-beta-alanine ligase [Besnoitia besnoiti]
MAAHDSFAQLGSEVFPAFASSFLPSSSPFFPFGAFPPSSLSGDSSKKEILVVHSPRELLAYRQSRPRFPLSLSCETCKASAARDPPPGGVAAEPSGGVSSSAPACQCASAFERLPAACLSRRRRISVVPTMGGLHDGHLSIIRSAACLGDEVWVSVFLNPLQFQSPTDFYTYPASIDDDMRVLAKAAVDLVFIPSPASLYPLDVKDTFSVQPALCKDPSVAPPVGAKQDEKSEMAPESPAQNGGEAAWKPPQRLFRMRVDFEDVERVEGEGRRRPGFFKGIGTVVSQLFTLIRPTYAHFGLKDFQQVACIKRLLCGLGLDTRLLAHSTWRDPDGMSTASRNNRLSPEERAHTQKTFRLLKHLEDVFQKGERNVGKLLQAANDFSQKEKLHLYYATLDRFEDAEPVVFRHTGGAAKTLSEFRDMEAATGRLEKRQRLEDAGDAADVHSDAGGPQNATAASGLSPSSAAYDSSADMCLSDAGRYCMTVAVRGNPLTTIVDNVVLVPGCRNDLLPQPFNAPWDRHCVDAKYRCFPSFLLLSSLGFHLRRLTVSDLAAIHEVEKADARLARKNDATNGGSETVNGDAAPAYAWMDEATLSRQSADNTWALGLFKWRLGTFRSTALPTASAHISQENEESLVGYVWADADASRETPASSEAESTAWRLRRVFIARAHRRRTIGTHLIKAFLATLCSEKRKTGRIASKDLETDPMPLWLVPAAAECGFSVTDAPAGDSKDPLCRMRVSLDGWFRHFVENLDL